VAEMAMGLSFATFSAPSLLWKLLRKNIARNLSRFAIIYDRWLKAHFYFKKPFYVYFLIW